MRPLLLIPACALAACTPEPANNTLSTGNAAEASAPQPTATPAPPMNTASPDPAPTVDNRSTARYRCMDESKLTANYDPDNRRVTIVRAGRELATLGFEPGTSGVTYKGDGFELRGKGDAMTFTAPGQPPLACTAIR